MESNFYSNQRGGFNSQSRRNNNSRFRSNRGGRGRGGGQSRNDRKWASKAQHHNRVAYNTAHIMETMKTSVPASIDLKNPGLITYVGEIYFKDSFLEDPWNESDQKSSKYADNSFI